MKRVAMLFVLAACGGGSGGGDDDGATVDAPATDASGTGDGPVATGDHLFADDLPWDRDVSGLPPAAQSAAIIAALDAAGGWGTGDVRTDLSIDVLDAAAGTPFETFTPRDETWAEQVLGDPGAAEFYRPDCDEVPYPVPPGGNVEGESGYACTGDGDCHLIVVDRGTRTLYEMWRADISGGEFLGGCAAVWDLDADYDPARLRGRGCTSADAGGFPITAMLATADEVASGEVRHALRFILPNSRIRDGIYVPPATHSTFPTSGGPSMPPYGVRFRLRASFDESTLDSEGARVLARALKRYGMFLADGGNLPLTIGSDRHTTAKWDTLGVDARSLSALEVTDFEVVDYGEEIDWNADTTCVRTP